MAANFLPLNVETMTKIEVLRMSRDLGIDRFSVVGRLLEFWFWMSKESVDGAVSGATFSLIDEIVKQDGFAAAMSDVGWLEATDDGVRQPGFDWHRPYSHKELQHANRAIKSRTKSSLLKSLKTFGYEGDDIEIDESATRVAPKSKKTRPKAHIDGDGDRELEIEKEIQNSGPDRTGGGNSQKGNESGSPSSLPGWPELDAYRDVRSAPELPPEGYLDATSAFSPLKSRHFSRRFASNLVELAIWHRRQLSLPSPVAGDSVADLLLCAATMHRVSFARDGTFKNRTGVFCSNVARQNWEPAKRSLKAAIKAFEKLNFDPETGWIVQQPVESSPTSEERDDSAERELQELEAEFGDQLEAMSIEDRLELVGHRNEFTRKAVARGAGRLQLLRELKELS